MDFPHFAFWVFFEVWSFSHHYWRSCSLSLLILSLSSYFFFYPFLFGLTCWILHPFSDPFCYFIYLFIWTLTPFPLLIFFCRFWGTIDFIVGKYIYLFLLFYPCLSLWSSIFYGFLMESLESGLWVSFVNLGLYDSLGGEAAGALSAWSMAELLGPRLYSCCNCRNHVAFHDDIISKAFQVMKLKPNPFVLFCFILSAFDHLFKRVC